MDELNQLTQEVIDLSDKMIDAVTRFVNEHGGFIDTSDNSYKTTIYSYIFNEELEVCEEVEVTGVEVIRDELCIRTERGTYSIDGGFVLVNATMYNLCEAIHEYVD